MREISKSILLNVILKVEYIYIFSSFVVKKNLK